MRFEQNYSEDERKDITVLTNLLAVLSQGVVKPNDSTHMIKKLESLQNQLSVDLTEAINCCPGNTVVYEAKEYHPLRLKVLDILVSKIG